MRVKFSEIEKEENGKVFLQFVLVSFGGLILTQATSEQGLSVSMIVAGFLSMIVFWVIAHLFFKGMKER